MKKLLLTFAVALTAVATNAQETKLTVVPPNQYWGSKDVTAATAGKVDFSDQYGEFKIKSNIDLSAYTGMIIKYSGLKDAQIKAVGDADDESTYSKKAEFYCGLEGAEGEAKIEFPASLGTTISVLELQGTAAGGTVTFDKITLLKGEEQEVLTAFEGMAWGGTYSKAAASAVDIKITDAYGEIGFAEAVSYDPSKVYTYTVSFSEPTPAALTFKVLTTEDTPGAALNDYDNKYYVNQDIAAGSTSASIVINYNYSAITLPCAVADNTFKGIEAKLTVSEATAISSTSAKAGVSSVYSVSGAKLNAYQKGVNIVKMTDGSIKKVLK